MSVVYLAILFPPLTPLRGMSGPALPMRTIGCVLYGPVALPFIGRVVMKGIVCGRCASQRAHLKNHPLNPHVGRQNHNLVS